MSHQSQKSTSPKPIRELALSRISVGRKHLQLPKRRGSVLILVIAVLVLLALMGTAYIATSRSERVTSSKSQSLSTIDVLAKGIENAIKGSVQKDLNSSRVSDTTGAPGTSLPIPVFSASPTAPGGFGMPLLASRAPTAWGNNPNYVALARWPVISAPLDAIPFIQGTTYPLQYPNPPYATAPAWTPYTDRTLVTQAVLPQAPAGTPLATPNAGSFVSPIYNVQVKNPSGSQDFMLKNSSDGTWGRYDSARRDLVIGYVTYGNATYPAFNIDTTGVGTPYWVLAADADGDGIADSGYSLLGTLSNPEFAGVTFVAGVRVIDNNSAINANTAWTGFEDYDFTSNTAPGGVVRNNRMFPSSIGLKESLSPLTLIGYPGVGSRGYDEAASGDQYYFYNQFITYRSSGEFLAAGAPLKSDHALKDVDPSTGATLFPPATITPTAFRDDYLFSTQLEMTWFQSGRRLEFPGMQAAFTASKGNRFSTFSLSDQFQLAYGFVLAQQPANVTSFSDALSTRTTLEQLLPYSLYRTNLSSYPGNTLPFVPTAPYSPDKMGNRNVVTPGTWYSDNFDFEPSVSGTNPHSAITNLRPFMVTRNPVSQASPFKPLPTSAIAFSADLMTPYVPLWQSGTTYVPGDMVMYNTTGRIYYLDATVLSNSSTAPGTFGGPWVEYTKPVIPAKVNVNKADFGDLWRAFYCTMVTERADKIDQLNSGSYSPFGPLGTLTTVEAQTYRGMQFPSELHVLPAFTPPNPVPTPTTPAQSQIARTSVDVSLLGVGAEDKWHPQRMFRSNVKDFSTGSYSSNPSYSSIDPSQMILVRSAMAAVNTEYLRAMNASKTVTSGSEGGFPLRDDIIRRRIKISARYGFGSPTAPVGIDALVYSNGRFPYITELYVNNENGMAVPAGPVLNAHGYVAIELYNPYPFDISLANFKLQLVPRMSGTTNTMVPPTAELPAIDLYNFGAVATAPVIKAGSFVVLENLTTSPSAGGAAGTLGGITIKTNEGAVVRPTGAKTPNGTGQFYYVAGLEQATKMRSGAIGSRPANEEYEIVISRPMIADITTTSGVPRLECLPPTAADPDRRVTGLATSAVQDSKVGYETAEYYVPFDSIDVSAVRPVEVTDTGSTTPYYVKATAYHYARKTDNWQFVYPGRYDARTTEHQQGMQSYQWIPLYYLKRDDTTTGQPANSGDDIAMSEPEVTLGGRHTPITAEKSSYSPTFPIQIANVGFGGPNALVVNDGQRHNRFPMGGFMRMGDMLEIPFISPVKYRYITGATPSPRALTDTPAYMDVVSLTADASFAEDTDPYDDTEENIGRFTPIMTPYPIVPTTSASVTHPYSNIAPITIDEYSTVTYNGGPKGYLDTIQARYGWATHLFDYLTVMTPNDMNLPDGRPNNSPLPSDIGEISKYPALTLTKRAFSVAAKSSNLSPVVGNAQLGVGIDGQININTAPLPVLAAVPWVHTGNLQADRELNLKIAQAIINYREPRANGFVTSNGAADVNRPFPFRPFRSLFELNRVLMVTINETTGDVAYAPTASFRTGGFAPSSTNPRFLNAADAKPVQEPTGLLTGQVSAFGGNSFLTPSNGCFVPGYIDPSTFPTYKPPVTGDTTVMPGTYDPSVALPDTQSGGPINNQHPVGDFMSQYLMMTTVSNLITVRSDTFTAYVVVEGWKNFGSTNPLTPPERVIQRRYAYLIDRSGAASSLPIEPGGTYSIVSSGIVTGKGNRALAAPVQSYAVPAVTPSN